ncbi:MAG: UDP-3-O-(3-hydroxymyristoyl)glucosamine N-acyltransferase [Candidatus Coatesbacteria bacterium]|nr:MAG: UDP-3-O-(3-hydroxymyristoyl)glucosamine N-acyltransferase [Candidatus Coatesbacteria bacterium]
MAEYTLEEIAAAVGGTVEGDQSAVVSGLSGIEEAGPEDITFVANPKYESLLKITNAGAVILGEGVDAPGLNVVRVADAYVAFARVLAMFAPEPALPEGVSDLAYIAADTDVDESAAVGPFAVIDAGAKVAARSAICSGAYIGRGSSVGEDCIIYPNVTIRERVTVGDRAIIHPNAVVGSDGFGFATVEGVHHKIPQIGTVVVGDDVEIGAGAAIDRGTMGATVIGDGCKIDNLVQIAHNVTLGKGTILAAQVGIAGSTKVGEYVVMGGQVGLVGHIEVGDRVQIGAQSGVPKSIPPGEIWFGYPARPIMETKRTEAYIRRLGDLYARVKALEKKLEEKG